MYSQLHGNYRKVFCVETVTSCWRLGVIYSLTVVAAHCGSSFFYLWRPFSSFFWEGLAYWMLYVPKHFILPWRRAAGRQGVREIILALLVPRVILSSLEGFRQPLPRLLPPFKCKCCASVEHVVDCIDFGARHPARRHRGPEWLFYHLFSLSFGLFTY